MKLSKLKLLIILMLSIMIINIAMPVQAISIDDIWIQGSNFLNEGKKNSNGTFNGKKMKDATDTLYSLFFGAGVAIAVIVGAYLGVKFMTEGVEGKAKIKEALIPFVIGCMIIFGGFSIWKIAMNLFSDIEQTETTASRDQQYDDEKCASGKHTYDNFEDKYCNNCNHYCAHSMGEADSTGTKKCNKDDCGLITTLCTSGYNGRTPGTHTMSFNTCQVCGYVCSGHKWQDFNESNHICSLCGAYKKHVWSGPTCSECKKQCYHIYYTSGGFVKCKNCNFSKDLCTKSTQVGGLGRKKHDYSINWYGGLICSYCNAPDTNNPPQY